MRLATAAVVLILAASPAGATDKDDCYSRDYQRSVRGCTRIIEARGTPRADLAMAHAARAGAYLSNGEIDKSRQDSDRAIEIDARNGLAWAWRGHLQNIQRDFKSAIASHGKAVELTPKDFGAWEGRALAKLGSNDFNGALSDAARATQINPKSASAHVIRARVRLAQSQPEQALPDLERALAINDKSTEAYYFRAQALRRLGQLDRALADTEKVLAQSDRYTSAYLLRGQLRGEMGKPREGLGDIDRVIAQQPNLGEAQASRALLSIGIDEFDIALRYANRAIELKNQQGHEMRGLAYLRLGEFDQAITDLTAAIVASGGVGLNALVARGQAHALRGQRDAAIADFESALKLTPWLPRERQSHALAKEKLAELKAGQAPVKQAATTTSLPAGSTDLSQQPAIPTPAGGAPPADTDIQAGELVPHPTARRAGGWTVLGNASIGYCVLRQQLPQGFVEYRRLADGTMLWLWQDERLKGPAGQLRDVAVTFDSMPVRTWRWTTRAGGGLSVSVPQTWLMTTLPRFERITLRAAAASADYRYTGFSQGYAVLGTCTS